MMNTITPAAAVAVALLTTIPAVAQDDAQPMRRHLFQAGWFHIEPQVRDNPLENEVYPPAAALLGIDSQFTSPGTGADVSSADTLALIYSYFIDENWAVKFEGGIAADFELSGYGVVQPSPLSGSVDLGSYMPLASATQWSPVVLVQYFFRESRQRLRPYAGVGVTYTWFTDVELDENFERDLNQRFGAPLSLLSGKTGATRVEAEADSDIAPVVNVGVSYDINDRWNVSGSLSYTLLETTATIDVIANDGTLLTRSTADVDLNPLVTALLIGYRF